jgi:carboxypeptidase Q
VHVIKPLRKTPAFSPLLVVIVTGVVVLNAGRVSGEEKAGLPIATLEQIQTVALQSDYGYSRLDYLCNKIGPRMSGSPQAAAAVQYVAKQFRELGLEVSLEPVMVPHWVRGQETAELIRIPEAPQDQDFEQKVILTALGGSVPTPQEGITASVVVVNSFEELDKLGEAGVKGKIVLFNVAFDTKLADAGFSHEAYVRVVPYRVTGAYRAAALGAVASLLRSIGPTDSRLAHTGSVGYFDGPKIPAGAISAEDADLIAHLSKAGPVVMHIVLTPKILPDERSANVIADLRGSDHPEQIVIVSAHLDSWDLGTGCIDNGAGIAEILQAASVFHEMKLRPRRTIRFIAWMNEENAVNGGNGYDQYAKDHRSELSKHVADIEIDVGTWHPVGYEFYGSEELRNALRPLRSFLGKISSGVVFMRPYAGDMDDFMAGLSPLADNRTYYATHHTVADTFAMIDPRGLQENAALMAVLGYAMASLPQEVIQHPLPK